MQTFPPTGEIAIDLCAAPIYLKNTEKRRLFPGRLIRVFKVSRLWLSFSLNYFMYNCWTTVFLRAFLGLVKGLDGRHIEHIFWMQKDNLSVWAKILLNRSTGVLETGRGSDRERWPDNWFQRFCSWSGGQLPRNCIPASLRLSWLTHHRNFVLSPLQEWARHFSRSHLSQNVGFLLIFSASVEIRRL